MTSVVFAVPSLTSNVALEFALSLLQTETLLEANGIAKRIYLTHTGDQYIARARNKLVARFLDEQPDVDDFFFLDDDLGFPPSKVLEFLRRPEDILVGAYPIKSENNDWPIAVASHEGQLIEREGLIRCFYGPTGFMRIRRHVLEAMSAKSDAFWDYDAKGEKTYAPTLFVSGVHEGRFWTEDYDFCRKAIEAGFEIWCDTDIDFTHRGTRAWKGNVKDVISLFRERARVAA